MYCFFNQDLLFGFSDISLFLWIVDVKSPVLSSRRPLASKIFHTPFLGLATQSSTRCANPGIDACPSQNIAGLGIFLS